MYTLNYGPHHPSTHGVLRLLLTMEGEQVIKCEPIIGYLHRGVEKLVESKQFVSIIPYIDRLDYLAPVISEHAYVLAIEKLLNIVVPRRALIIRTIFDELTRISCHIMGIGCATYDMGLMNIFLYGMEEREKIMNIFYNTTGNRMHLAYYIPGGITNDINSDIINSIKLFINKLDFYLNTVEILALNNRIFKQRTENVSIISKELAIKYGISGVNLRSTGIKYDIREMKPYGIYKELNFKSIILNKSDCYNRTYLRYLEIKQSINLIKQCLEIIEPGEYCSYNNYNRQDGSTFFNFNLKLPENNTIYSSVENSRGEFGIHLFTGNNPCITPYRIHFKSPSFAIIQMLKELLRNTKLADVSAILGSLDFIIGDCDR